MSEYEVTIVDGPRAGKSMRLTEEQGEQLFGRDEWQEYKAGYLPHVVVVELNCPES